MVRDASHDALDSGMRAVTIRFIGRVGDAALECNSSYANQGTTATTVTPRDFRFYVQDLKLVTAGGDELDVKLDARDPWQADGVAMIDLEDATGRCEGTPETNDRITGHVPAGSYTGVRFANGVPEAFNHADPTTLPPVLQIPGMYWSWLTGFRFMKVEVEQVLDGDDDAGAVPGYGLFHPGATACGGAPGGGGFQCSKLNRNAVRLDHFDPDRDAISVDLGAIFATSDLTQNVQCHGSDAACAPLLERIGVDADTGQPLAGAGVSSRVSHGLATRNAVCCCASAAPVLVSIPRLSNIGPHGAGCAPAMQSGASCARSQPASSTSRSSTTICESGAKSSSATSTRFG